MIAVEQSCSDHCEWLQVLGSQVQEYGIELVKFCRLVIGWISLEKKGGWGERSESTLPPVAKSLSPGLHRHATVESEFEAMGQQESNVLSVLNGFDPQIHHRQLRYGDSISLAPEGYNGFVAFAGSEDCRPWVEILQDEIAVPPNLRDCQFQLQPARYYVEAKKLHKVIKEAKWDNGIGLPLPNVPGKMANCQTLASELVAEHNLPFAKT